MDQKQVGSFLKELRKEKGITQEEFAERLNVSGRTISRWETGTNMPDISLIVEIAEFFDVSIPEIINGKRRSEIMNEEVKEVAESLSDYANTEKETIVKSIRNYSIMGTIAMLVYSVLEITGFTLKNEILGTVALYCETLVSVTVILIMVHTTGVLYKLQKGRKYEKIKRLPKVVQMIIGAIVAFTLATIIKLLLNSILGARIF